MRLEQLQFFLEISTSGSIRIAAENLYISQSALSRSIKSLEDELGVQLLLRAVDGVRLTTAGEQLLPYMRDVLNKAHSLSQAAERYTFAAESDTLSGQLTICTIPVIADSLLLPALAQMYVKFPAVKIDIQLQSNADPLKLTFPETADLLIWMNVDHTLDQALETAALHAEPLFADHFSLVCAKTHPLAKKKTAVLEEALTYKTVAHHNGFPVEAFYSQLAPLDKPLDIILRSNNTRVITQALLEQEAVLISNNQMIRMDYCANEDLAIIPLKNHKGLYFALYDAHNPYRRVIDAFIDIIKALHAGL